MKDRGMMKWLPYQSLTEQGDFLLHMKRSIARVEKPLHANEEAERIDRKLREYHGQPVTLTIYEEGEIKEWQGTIQRIDPDRGIFYLDGLISSLANIVTFEDDELDYDLFGC